MFIDRGFTTSEAEAWQHGAALVWRAWHGSPGRQRGSAQLAPAAAGSGRPGVQALRSWEGQSNRASLADSLHCSFPILG